MWGDLWIHATPYGHLVDNSGNNVILGMSERCVNPVYTPTYVCDRADMDMPALCEHMHTLACQPSTHGCMAAFMSSGRDSV